MTLCITRIACQCIDHTDVAAETEVSHSSPGDACSFLVYVRLVQVSTRQQEDLVRVLSRLHDVEEELQRLKATAERAVASQSAALKQQDAVLKEVSDEKHLSY